MILLNVFLANMSTVFLLYTDPGSGALLLQLVFAALLGGAFYLRRIKDKIFRLFASSKTDSGKEETDCLPENVN